MDSVLSPPAAFRFNGNSLDLASGTLSEKWKKWRQSYEIYSKACEITEKSKDIQLNILLHVLGDQCRDILEQLNVKYTTADGVLDLLDQHFKTKKNVTLERHKFFTRNQKENESIEQYVFELRRLSQNCEFSTLNDELIKDRLVCGVISPAIRERLLREEDLNLKKALEICRTVVASRVYSEKIKQQSDHLYEIEEENSGVFAVRRGVSSSSWRGRGGGSRGRGRGRGAGVAGWQAARHAPAQPPAPPGVRAATTTGPRAYSSRGGAVQRHGGAVPVFRRALLFPSRVALQDEFGIYTYAGLHQAAADLSKEIAAMLLGDTQKTITYMCGNDASHIIVQWAIWMTGNIAVPLTPIHPPEMLKYFIDDSSSSLVVCSPEFEKTLEPIAKEKSKPLLVTSRNKEMTAQMYDPNSAFLKPKAEDDLSDVGKSNTWYGDNDAMLIYTSGTTSKPKGVVWSHSMLNTHIASLHSAWQYSSYDVVLHTLPLHHIHGQLNSMLASLAAGARLRMLPSFTSHTVWARLLGMGEREENKVTVFHGVPAMYARLVADHEKLFDSARMQQYVRTTLAARMRLMVAGSAPLPDTLFNKWEQISGIRLLERYGMSEVGMALSNPYRPLEDRTVGHVGLPLPGVLARIAMVDERTKDLVPLVTVETPLPDCQISLNRLGVTLSAKDFFKDSTESGWRKSKVTEHQEATDGVFQGELLLKGPGVFTRYWNRPLTLDSGDFTHDGWFRTGDTAAFADNRFRILGRTSVDIIKTSGYKVSALQVESAILEHPSVDDVAVLGIEDETYGEVVAAIIVVKGKANLTLKDIKDETGKKLAPYQLPKTILIVDKMPRNAMGKLDKKEIRKLYGKDLVLKPKKK